MSLEITRRKWLTATIGEGLIMTLAGCSGDSEDTLVEGEAHSREHWRFDLTESDRIAITVEIRERPSLSDAAKIDIETVADGVVAGWELPYGDVEDTFHFTAETDAEHTLKVYHAGIAEVSVEKVNDA